jgi:hypothetical protein
VRFAGPIRASLKRLVASPLLARIRELELQDEARHDPDLGPLLASPHLDRLESFSFDRDLQTPAILTIARRTALRALALHRCGRMLDEKLIAAIADMPALRELTLEVSRAMLPKLLASPRLGVEKLFVHESYSPSADEATIRIGERLAGSLRVFELVGSHFGEPVARALAGTHVERLRLERGGLTPDGAKAIARLRSVRHLGLERNEELGAAGVRALADLPLASLDVSYCELDAAAIRELAAFRSVGWLDVRANTVDVESVRALASLPALRQLDVSRCGLDNACAEALAASPPPRLHDLDVTASEKLTRPGVRALASIPTLRTLTLGRTESLLDDEFRKIDDGVYTRR